MTSTNLKLVETTIEALGKGDIKTALDNFSDDIHFAFKGDTPLSCDTTGKAEFIDFLKSVGKYISKPVNFKVTRMIEAGDTIVSESTGDSANRSGEPYCNEYCHIWKVKDGKICEFIEYCDTHLVMNRLIDQ